MQKKNFSFDIPANFRLVFAALFCLTVLCGCGASNGQQEEQPQPKVSIPPYAPDINNTELGRRIIQDYFDFLKPVHNQVAIGNFRVESLWIEKEYGTFNGTTVVWFNEVFAFPDVIRPTQIGGACIDYNYAYRIIAWRGGEIFTIFSAVENKILSDADLQEMASISNMISIGKCPERKPVEAY